MITMQIDDGLPQGNYDDSEDLLSDEQREEMLQKRKEIKIPERRLQQFRDEYDCVVVMEFGDEYHLSEEERQAKNQYYQTFKKIRRQKKKYRKLPEYIDAMRDCLEVLDVVAKNNGFYAPEKFKLLYLEGKIWIGGLEFPKYTGRERKSINWRYLAEFVVGNEPSENILPKSFNDEVLTEEEEKEIEEMLFTKEELKNICSDETEEEKLQASAIDNRSNKTRFDIALPLGSKSSKRIKKLIPEIEYSIKETKRKNKGIRNLDSYLYNLTSADIREIERYDKRVGYNSNNKMPKFKGNFFNPDDYNRYMDELDEWEDENEIVEYAGKLITKEKMKDLELKSFLEEHGYNIRNLYGNKEKERKLKKLQRKERQKERALKKRLVEIQNRKKKRSISGDDYDDHKVKKKKKKKKKKHDKKILKATGNNRYESMDDWKQDAFNWMED